MFYFRYVAFKSLARFKEENQLVFGFDIPDNNKITLQSMSTFCNLLAEIGRRVVLSIICQ